MKFRWTVYVVVAMLSIGAGVAVAGLPDNAEVDPTILPPTATEEPAVIEEPASTTTTTTTAPASIEPESTDPEATDPDATEPASTGPGSTDAESADTQSTAPDTSDPTGSIEPEPALPDRGEIVTVTANGAAVGGTATRWSEVLADLGYVDVQPLDGTLVVDLSVVYYADGFEQVALRLAEDMALLPEFIAPLEEAPIVVDLPDGVELVAYLGLDRA